MKLGEVFRYEFGHRLRAVSTWVYAAILFGIGLSLQLAADPRAPVHANAPSQLAWFMLLAGSLFFGLPISAALFGDAAVRDVHAEMDPLLFTSSVRKAEYLGGRFLAAVAANAVVLLGLPLGLAGPALVGYPDPAAFGPFRVAAFLQPYLFILLPNMVFAGAILFLTGVLTRKLIPVYLSAIALFVLTMITLGPDADDNVSPVLSVLGPLGLHALNEITNYWTAAEQNARLVGLSTHLVWNRVLWLAAAAAVLAALHRRFRFAHPDGDGRRRKASRAIAGPVERERAGPVEVPRVAGSFGPRTAVRQMLAVTRRSLAEVAGNRWFVVVLLGCAGLTMLWGWNVGSTVFDTSTWPVTFLVAEVVLSQRAVLLIYALIAVFAGELVWKDRDSGVAEIAGAAPVPDGAALLGRFLALVAVLVMFQAATMVGGILIQAFQGYHHFEPGLYLRIVFGLDLADYVLLAALAMTIHVVVNHKNMGHIAVLLAIVLIRSAGQLGIRHHLLIYGTDPGWTYSDMNGLGPFLRPFVWFKLYWAAWALLVLVVAALFRVRGREPGLHPRLRVARARLTGPVLGTAGLGVGLILALGGFVFYNTNVLNEYHSADRTGASQADYEHRYKRFEDASQPTLTAAELRVEIHPDEPGVDLSGSYRLVNRTGAAIDSVHVFLDPPIQAHSLSLDHPADPVWVDAEAGYRIFALARPLQPGDSLRLSFEVSFRPRGFPNDGIQSAVVSNGAYFDRSWLPFIGYQPAFELSGAAARSRFGLEPRSPLPGPDDVEARQYRSSIRNEDRVQVDATIGTAADQTAFTPGVLRRNWTENGRRYVHYETEGPTSFGGAILSAKYAVLGDRWNDVVLRIFHHPAHSYDLDRMVRGMKASLDYYTKNFGPYRSRGLSIVELPRYGGVGHAGPATIAFAEDIFLNRVEEGQVDQPFFGTAHEVAHQWWGGQVRPAPVRGHGLLTESLANYSAMMVVEKSYGPGMARRVFDFQMQRYLRGRATFSREVPLLEVDDQPYIAYRKGAVALYTLRRTLGEDAMNTALRRYLERYRDAGPPYPTSRDLYAELRAVTPDSLQTLLTDLFETVTLWDVRTERATVAPTDAGAYQVTLVVTATKMRADSVGNETEVPMDDLVEVGVFAASDGAGTGEPLYLKRLRIRSGEQTIRITVPREPVRAGIDPYHMLIDRKGNDNVVGVTSAPTRGGGT